MKKETRFELRLEPSIKRYLEFAAAFDRKTLSGLLTHAALTYADTLRGRGWKAKPPPIPRDGRRTTKRTVPTCIHLPVLKARYVTKEARA